MAEALFRMTYLENWGSGAKRIIDACRAQNVEEPTWSDTGGFITVTFKHPSQQSSGTIQSTIQSTIETNNNTQEGGESTLETTNSTQESTQKNRTSTQEKILNILRENPTLSTSEVASKLGTTRDGIRKALEKLNLLLAAQIDCVGRG